MKQKQKGTSNISKYMIALSEGLDATPAKPPSCAWRWPFAPARALPRNAVVLLFWW